MTEPPLSKVSREISALLLRKESIDFKLCKCCKQDTHRGLSVTGVRTTTRSWVTSTARIRLSVGGPGKGIVQRRAGVPSTKEGGAYIINDRSSPVPSSKQTLPPKESGKGPRNSRGVIKWVISPNPNRPTFISTFCVNWPAQSRALYCRSFSTRSGMVRPEERAPSTIPLIASSMRYARSVSALIRVWRRRETCKRRTFQFFCRARDDDLSRSYPLAYEKSMTVEETENEKQDVMWEIAQARHVTSLWCFLLKAHSGQ